MTNQNATKWCMNGDEFWSIVGKILALVGGISAFIKIIEWVSSPRQKLVVSVESVPFELPESKTALEKISSFRSMWIVSIENKGKKPCEGINLTLPNATLTRISRIGVADEYRKLTDGVISIDSLNPLETVYLCAWATWGAYSTDPSKVRLSHKTGVGIIRPRASAPKFFQDIETIVKEGSKGLFIGVLVGLVIIGLAALAITVVKLATHKMGNDKQTAITNTIPSISAQPTNSIHPN